jgi:hypothetical protein
MKNKLFFLFLLLSCLLLFSCKKCKICECEKNGQVYEEKNCAYGGGSSNKTLETWEQYLREEKGYDKVTCRTE